MKAGQGRGPENRKWKWKRGSERKQKRRSLRGKRWEGFYGTRWYQCCLVPPQDPRTTRPLLKAYWRDCGKGVPRKQKESNQKTRGFKLPHGHVPKWKWLKAVFLWLGCYSPVTLADTKLYKKLLGESVAKVCPPLNLNSSSLQTLKPKAKANSKP